MGEVRLRVRAKEKPISAVPLARDRLLLVLGREALAPKGSVERIDDLRFRPVERVENADATDKSAAVDFFAGPLRWTPIVRQPEPFSKV